MKNDLNLVVLLVRGELSVLSNLYLIFAQCASLWKIHYVNIAFVCIGLVRIVHYACRAY